MSRSSYVESPIVAQAEPEVPRFERIATLIGLATFLTVLAIGLVLYLARFQVDHRITRASLWLIAIAGVVAFIRTTPASRLTPLDRMIRGKRQAFFLLGLLTGVAALGCIVTATQLNTPLDWARLIFIASSPIGIGLLVRTRFSIG